MHVEPLETIIAQLKSDNWLEVGSAIRKLIPHNEAALVAIPLLFELTMHEKAPVASDSALFIKQLGKIAVPFLRDQAVAERPSHREMAILLLSETGLRWMSSTFLIEQLLESRRDDLPDWGSHFEEIIKLFKFALDDKILAVRFRAASALEEFGLHISETIQVFIEVLQAGTPDQQNWAALHLGRIGPMAVAARDELAIATESKCEYTSLAAKNALKLIDRNDTL